MSAATLSKISFITHICLGISKPNNPKYWDSQTCINMSQEEENVQQQISVLVFLQ